jgi:hypothetical protein
MWKLTGLLLVTTVLGVGASAGWQHGWDTTAAMTFADYNSDKLLTDAQARFVAAKWVQSRSLVLSLSLSPLSHTSVDLREIGTVLVGFQARRINPVQPRMLGG